MAEDQQPLLSGSQRPPSTERNSFSLREVASSEVPDRHPQPDPRPDPRQVPRPDRNANPRRSLVMVIWLTLQLVVSAIMTTLSTFHQFAPGSTLPCTENATDVNATITSCPSWRFSIASMTFTILFLIFSIGDATINMHHLVHQVLNKNPDESDCEFKTHEENTFKSCCSKFPMDAVRVCYCWIMLTIILITVTANTYEWSWQTDNLKVLSNTALFFFTWITYILLLIVGILVWHCNFYPTETEKCKSCCVSIPSIVLIVINTVVIALLVFICSDLEAIANFAIGSQSQLYFIQIGLVIATIIYVCLSMLIWLTVVCIIVHVIGKTN